MIKFLIGVMVAAIAAAAWGQEREASMPVLEAAPSFTVESAAGKKVSLSDFKGKYVVLEWWNYGCPFVRKHYGSGNMQKLQAEMKKKGVIWLTVCSSASGMQGNVTAEQANEMMKELKGMQTAVLLDPTGEMGRKFKARVTPHMFLISPKGDILYNGALDSIPSADRSDIAKATNYVMKAYEEASAGKSVSTPKTQPYGCGIKYNH